MNYKISILVPVFNVEKYLPRALESIIAQSIGIENLEVIMINDASTDSSTEIMNDYASKYDNFKAIHLDKNSGSCGRPFNFGLKEVTAPYVMFLGSDDTFAPDYCEVLYNKIANSDYDVVKCNFIMVDASNKDEKQTITSYFNENQEEIILTPQDLPLRFVSVCNGIHKASLAKTIKFPEGVIAEDIGFTVEEWIKMDKMLYLNHFAGYKYYTNPEASHARTISKEKFYSTLEGFKLGGERLKGKNMDHVTCEVYAHQMLGLIERVMYYDGSKSDKINFLKDIYEFEKDLGVNLTLTAPIFNFANKLIMKKSFRLALTFLDVFRKIR